MVKRLSQFCTTVYCCRKRRY